MKFVIKHEIKGRIRAHAVQYRMTFEQADRMQYYLESQDMITSAKVQNRTGDFTICYKRRQRESNQTASNIPL